MRLLAPRPVRPRVPCPRGVACAFHALAALARVVRARVAIMRSGHGCAPGVRVVRAWAVVAHSGHGHALGAPSVDGGPRRWAAARSRASSAPPRARAAPAERRLCAARACRDRPSLARPAASKFQNSPCPVSPAISFKFQNNLSPVNSFPPPPGSSPRAVPVLPAPSASLVAIAADARPLVPIPTLALGPDARRQRRSHPFPDPYPRRDPGSDFDLHPGPGLLALTSFAGDCGNPAWRDWRRDPRRGAVGWRGAGRSLLILTELLLILLLLLLLLYYCSCDYYYHNHCSIIATCCHSHSTA